MRQRREWHLDETWPASEGQSDTADPDAEPAGRSRGRPRLLIEDPDPVLVVSDLRAFHEAGFDVAVCSGPGQSAAECPLVSTGECPLADRADVVLFGLGDNPTAGTVLNLLRQRFPGLPVVVKLSPSDSPEYGARALREGWYPLATAASLDGQVHRLWEALLANRQPPEE